MYDSDDKNVLTTVKKDSGKTVYLTIDDGPSRILPQMLDVLRDENVPALFFWQSRLLYEKRPWKRVLDEGHMIGSHSTKHLNLANLSYEQQFHDIQHSVKKIEQVTGTKVKYFRPPFGQYNQDTIAVTNELQLTPVMWRIASVDWEHKNDPHEIINHVTSHLEDGAIILIHELHQTLEILPDLIKEVRARGYNFSKLF
ncbi:polysaccharide deacetylase family protein [Bacillus sp. PS06]|uniref:polysaccharide deacetylase family protein n=1 Tax=Bacillus sp. PS06 TaxID=2764176 RepID=UPI00296F5C56|nr:polysaccharide deacetylase family protein [Bacillus sp. PS06]